MPRILFNKRLLSASKMLSNALDCGDASQTQKMQGSCPQGANVLAQNCEFTSLSSLKYTLYFKS